MTQSGTTTELFDYNGTGRWSLDAVQRRYAEYARRFRVATPLNLKPRQHQDGQRQWTYPVMEAVVNGIETGDAACIEIGVEFIESDEKFPFGKILKSRTARVLRRASLNSYHIERIRQRVIGMLAAGIVPHEFGDYAKLLRKIGVGPQWFDVRDGIDRTNPHVAKFFDHLDQASLRPLTSDL